MNTLTLLYAAAVAAATALTILTIWSHRAVGVKVAALACGAVLMATSYGAFAELLGRPKPVHMDWFASIAADPRVIGSQVEEDVAIYLWVVIEDDPEPLAYKLPWSMEAAKKLHEASQESQQKGTSVRVQGIDRSESTELTFYSEPQSPLPPKKTAEAQDGPRF